MKNLLTRISFFLLCVAVIVYVIIPQSEQVYAAAIVNNTEIEVNLDVTYEEIDNYTYFTIETNMPDGTIFMLRLTGDDYVGSTKATVENGFAVSSGFSDSGEKLQGDYSLEVSSLNPKAQPSSVTTIIGINGEFLSGPYVDNSTGLLNGKVVHRVFEFTFGDCVSIDEVTKSKLDSLSDSQKNTLLTVLDSTILEPNTDSSDNGNIIMFDIDLSNYSTEELNGIKSYLEQVDKEEDFVDDQNENDITRNVQPLTDGDLSFLNVFLNTLQEEGITLDLPGLSIRNIREPNDYRDWVTSEIGEDFYFIYVWFPDKSLDRISLEIPLDYKPKDNVFITLISSALELDKEEAESIFWSLDYNLIDGESEYTQDNYSIYFTDTKWFQDIMIERHY